MRYTIILLLHDEGWRERTRGFPSTFPSLAGKKSRIQSKAQESESQLGGWTHSSFPCVPGFDFFVVLLGWALLAWCELTLTRATSSSLRPHFVLWLLRIGYPDGIAGGSTWLSPRRGARSPSWNGAGTRHSQPGGGQLQAWWCDPQGIIPPVTRLQPRKPHCGVGYGSCVEGVGQVKRLRREALGVSCLQDSYIRGGSPSGGHTSLAEASAPPRISRSGFSWVWVYFLQLLLHPPSTQFQRLPWWQGAHITPSITASTSPAMWWRTLGARGGEWALLPTRGPKLPSLILAINCYAEVQPCKALGYGTCSNSGPAWEELSSPWRKSFPWQAFFSPSRPWHRLMGWGILSPCQGKGTSLPVPGERQNDPR